MKICLVGKYLSKLVYSL